MQAPQTPLPAASGAGARWRAGEPARRPKKPPRKLRARLVRIAQRPCHESCRGAPRPLTRQLLVAGIPAQLRDPERGGEVCVRGEREQTARRFAAAFLASRPSPARGSWPRSRELRSRGRRERRRAALWCAPGGLDANPSARHGWCCWRRRRRRPPTVPPPHTASGSLTHSRRVGRRLVGGRGLREGTGLGHGGRRCRGAEWSLGSCSSPTEEKRDTLLRT